MNKPKRQHFIPKSYLKNFAVANNEKYFVEAKIRSDNEPKKDLVSIKDICVSKNIYTIPNKENDEKYALENYYASEIDEVYPEVYELLVDPKNDKITIEQRGKIIKTTMNLFFRTPKFLNSNQRAVDAMLKYGSINFQDKEGNIKFKFKNYDLDFNIKDIEEVRSKLKIDNKNKFLKSHIQDWYKFINFKLMAAISVYRICDEIELITSDNPVIMHSVEGNEFNLFDPTNMIALPLDSKHYLSIFPNTEEAILDTIYRCDRDKWFALTTNLQVERSCDEWIIGKPNSITNHLADQLKYNEESAENLQAEQELKQKAEDAMDLVKIIEQYGFPHQKIADKVKELLESSIHFNNLELIKIKDALAKHGYNT
ncbi:DUF4238 domain-containing protein [bacterium]|nr:MAG: DUF4238 domain-containing protein [bacterium]